MASPIQIRPAELIRPNDNPALIRLFSQTLKMADSAAMGKPRASVPPPGPFWLLANGNPSLADMVRFWNGEVPQGWPQWFARNAKTIQNHPLRDSFLHCLGVASEAGIDSAQDVCRVMAAVAQTLFSTNITIVEGNRRVAGLPVPSDAWSDEDLFVSARPDERGGCVAIDHVAVWMASQIGPAYVDTIENQDAVYAIPCGGSLAFALADGVSTSLGSRYAAALATFRFCHGLRDLEQKAPLSCDALLKAVRNTQEGMDKLLDRILADPGSELRARAMGIYRKQAGTEQAILENTRSAEKSSLPPALATTLIGGFIQPPARAAQFTCCVLCIGDGVVEKIDREGEVHRLIITDPDETAISVSMRPGPASRDYVRSSGMGTCRIDLHEGDHLLISSDGLARGHSQSVWHKIREVVGDIRPRLQRGDPDAVANVLRELTDKASELKNEGPLFDDNVSLVVVAAG